MLEQVFQGHCGCPLALFKARLDSFEQPGQVGDVPALGRGMLGLDDPEDPFQPLTFYGSVIL